MEWYSQNAAYDIQQMAVHRDYEHRPPSFKFIAGVLPEQARLDTAGARKF